MCRIFSVNQFPRIIFANFGRNHQNYPANEHRTVDNTYSMPIYNSCLTKHFCICTKMPHHIVGRLILDIIYLSNDCPVKNLFPFENSLYITLQPENHENSIKPPVKTQIVASPAPNHIVLVPHSVLPAPLKLPAAAPGLRESSQRCSRGRLRAPIKKE